MSQEYVAGNFYKKYYYDNDSKASYIIENERPWILNIIKEYNNIIKEAKEKYEKWGKESINIDGADISFSVINDLNCIIDQLEKKPKEFCKNLEEIDQTEVFFKYVLEADKRNDQYKRELEEHKALNKRELLTKCYILVIGVLLGILIHQLSLFF